MSPARAVLARIPISDYVLTAIALALSWLVVSATVPRYGAAWYAVAEIVIHLGLSAALLVRHVWRRTSFVVTYVLLAGLAAVVWFAPYNLGVSPLILCAPLSLYVVARHEPAAWGAAALLLGVAGSFVSPARHFPGGGGQGWIALMILGMLGTYLWATGRRRTDLAYADRLARGVAQAQADERARIARELHDVVAHSLTVVQVQASTGLALGTADRMRESLTNIKASSRTALAEVRSLVAVLRDDAGVQVAGDLTRLPDLVAETREAGVRLEADLPDADTLRAWQDTWPAQLRLTVLRVVQEALTNVIKHGGTGPRATLSLIDADTELRIKVTNDQAVANADPGYGLVGLRERVTLAGGVLDAGPHAGGFRLLATVPHQGAPS